MKPSGSLPKTPDTEPSELLRKVVVRFPYWVEGKWVFCYMVIGTEEIFA